mgnify:CR=1
MKKTTIGIDGMMCGMCESHINDLIRQNFNVKSVKSSHAKNETVVISENELDEEQLKNAVAKAGYTVTSVITEEYCKKGLFGLFGNKK